MTNTILAKMVVQISAQTAEFGRTMNQMSGTLSKMGSLLGATFGSAALFQGIRAGIGIMMDFEKTMSEVRAITGATGEEFKALENDAKRLGASTKYTATQVGELQIAYGRLGFTTKEILDATEATLDLAAATGEDLAKSADVAGSTVRGFQLNASETQRVVDVMASSFNKTALGLDNFTESMKYVAPVANAAGATVEETTALLGTLADAGIRGSMAGTSLRKIFTDMTKDGRPLKERLAELAAKGITLSDSFDEVGRTAQTSLLILSKNTEKTEELASAFEHASGEASQMARIMQDNLAGDVTKLTSAWEGLIIAVGESDIFRAMTQDLTMFLNALTNTKDIQAELKYMAEAFKNGEANVQGVLDRLIAKLAEVRKESGKPIDTRIVQELGEKYKLSDEQVNKFYQAVVEANKALSFQEKVVKQIQDLQQEKKYETITEAANDYKDKIYEQLFAKNIELEQLKKYTPELEKDISLTQSKIAELRRAILITNEYASSITKLTAATAAQNGLSLTDIIKFQKPNVQNNSDDVSLDEMLNAGKNTQEGVKDYFDENTESIIKQTEAYLGLGEAQQTYDINLQQTMAYLDAYKKKQEEIDDAMKTSQNIAMDMAGVIGNAFGEAIAGQKKFGEAMKAMIPQLMRLFLTEALGAIITAGAKQGAKSGNAIVGVLAATAGAAAIGALFSKHTGSGGGGGSSVSASMSGFSQNFGSANSSAQNSAPQLITVLKGSDLWVMLSNYQNGNQWTRAVG